MVALRQLVKGANFGTKSGQGFQLATRRLLWRPSTSRCPHLRSGNVVDVAKLKGCAAG